MKTDGLKQALDKYGFDAAFGGARRDEEKIARQGTHLLLPHGPSHAWDPKNQRPELWSLFNTRIRGREHPRLPAVQLDRTRYLGLHPRRGHPDRAALFRRSSVRSSSVRHLDHASMTTAETAEPGETPEMRMVRFRTLGCYPLTGAIEIRRGDARRHHRRDARARTSERQGRLIDRDEAGSMEKKKREGYF
jgi:sulfate adenylyltransferase subunit 2